MHEENIDEKLKKLQSLEVDAEIADAELSISERKALTKQLSKEYGKKNVKSMISGLRDNGTLKKLGNAGFKLN